MSMVNDKPRLIYHVLRESEELSGNAVISLPLKLQVSILNTSLFIWYKLWAFMTLAAHSMIDFQLAFLRSHFF